uniref:YcjF family protein n=1 Tax=Stappia sp. TaxID=1870903 RepID=UPI003BABACA9
MSERPRDDTVRKPRAPRAVRLDTVRPGSGGPRVEESVDPQADAHAFDAGQEARALPERRGIHWGRWLMAGLGGLASLAVGISVDALIRDLFSRTDWLGWLGVALAALAVLAAFGLILREVFGLMRLRRIDDTRLTLASAAEADDERTARKGLADLVALYGDRPDTAGGRAALKAHLAEVIDGRDLVRLAERDLLAPLDARAVRIVRDSVKRVSVVTAVSPRAALDLAVVLLENLRIMRRLATLYGGRPGFFGFLRLARHVAAHLAMTGGMAAGDSLVSQLLGHGIAARLSARLGEGVINGLLTARVGIAAIAVCRPAPFVDGGGPAVSDVMGELFRSDPEARALIETAEGRREAPRAP